MDKPTVQAKTGDDVAQSVLPRVPLMWHLAFFCQCAMIIGLIIALQEALTPGSVPCLSVMVNRLRSETHGQPQAENVVSRQRTDGVVPVPEYWQENDNGSKLPKPVVIPGNRVTSVGTGAP